MTVHSPLHTQRGFTLVEMLIAILLMTVGVIATLSLISASMNANTHANRLTTKTALAQQMVEDLLSYKDIEVPATNKVYNLNMTGAINDLTAQGAGTYHAIYTTTQISPASPAPRPFLIRIDTNVWFVDSVPCVGDDPWHCRRTPDIHSHVITSVYRYLE